MGVTKTSTTAMRKMDLPKAQPTLIQTQSKSVARQPLSAARCSPFYARVSVECVIQLIRSRVGPSQWPSREPVATPPARPPSPRCSVRPRPGCLAVGKHPEDSKSHQPTHGLSSSPISHSSQQPARTPSPARSPGEVYVSFPHQRVPPKHSHDRLTRCCPVHSPPPLPHLWFRAPSVSLSAPRVHFPSPLEPPPHCLSP